MLPIQIGFALLAVTLCGLATLAFRRRCQIELRARIVEIVAAAARRNLAIAPAVERMAQAARGTSRRVLLRLAAELDGGASVPDALARALPPRMLPGHVLDGLRSAEGTPALRHVLISLAQSRESVLNIQDRISMALAYPSLLAVMLFGLNLTTEALLDFDAGDTDDRAMAASWLAGNGAALLIWCGIAVTLLLYLAGSRGPLRDLLTRAASLLSGPRRLIQLSASARLLRSAASLIESDLPLGEVLRRAAASAGLPRLTRATRAAADLIDTGAPVADVWHRTGLPDFATALLTLSSGSDARSLASRMAHAARACDRRVERAVDRGVAALQPIAVTFFGALIAVHFSTVMHRLDIVRATAIEALPW